MKNEFVWIPLLSASLLCAGSNHSTRAGADISGQGHASPADAGQPVSSTPDGGMDGGAGNAPPEDAGTALSFPDPAEMLRGDVTLDGPTFKAVRVAMDDLKPRTRKPPADKVEACLDDESAYDFQVQRRGNLFFVTILTIPERCDPNGVYLDGGVRYIIDAGGHILLKRYEGQR